MPCLTICSIFVLGFVMVLGPNPAHGNDSKGGQNAGSLSALLLSDDSDTRCLSQKRILKERDKMIAELVALIDDPKNQFHRPDSVAKAMETLGAMRSIEAIDVLTQNIGFPRSHHPRAKEHERRVPFYTSGTMASAERTPAVEALKAIGEPCVLKVIAKLVETNSAFEQRACIAVLRSLNEHVRVRESLQAALEQVADEPTKEKLERALRDVTRQRSRQSR